MLVRYDQNDMELVIDNETGEAFATVRGAARMLSVDPSTVSRRTSKGVASSLVKTSEIKTGQGVQRVSLIPAELIFEWAIKDNPTLAVQMGKAGATVFLYGLAGYEVKPAEPAQPKTYIEALRALLESEEEKERQRVLLEQQRLELESAEKDVELLSEAVDELFEYSSIIRIAKFNNVDETSFHWRTLKTKSISMGYELKRVPCPRFEYKMLYHHRVWAECYPDVALPETQHWNLNLPR